MFPTRKPRRRGRVAVGLGVLAIMLPALQAAGPKAHPRFWPLRRAAANVEVTGQELLHEAPI
jgi:hypothetical protein